MGWRIRFLGKVGDPGGVRELHQRSQNKGESGGTKEGKGRSGETFKYFS